MSLSLELRNLNLRFWKDRKPHAVPGTFSDWESHLLETQKEGQDCTQNTPKFSHREFYRAEYLVRHAIHNSQFNTCVVRVFFRASSNSTIRHKQ